MVFAAIDHWLANKDDTDAVQGMANAISEYVDILSPPPSPSSVFHKKYSIGTFAMTGYGYFCPSPMMNVVINNAKRGRLVNTAKNYSHIYYFDSDEKLHCIDAVGKDLSLLTRSCLFVQDTGEILPMWRYDKKGECDGLFSVTFAKYQEGKIRCFIVAEINSVFIDFWIEDYQWSDRKMVLDKIFVMPSRSIKGDNGLPRLSKKTRSEWSL